jgi:hypothetical protein
MGDPTARLQGKQSRAMTMWLEQHHHAQRTDTRNRSRENDCETQSQIAKGLPPDPEEGET